MRPAGWTMTRFRPSRWKRRRFRGCTLWARWWMWPGIWEGTTSSGLGLRGLARDRRCGAASGRTSRLKKEIPVYGLAIEFHDIGYALNLLRLSRREINEFYAVAEPVTVADYCADAQKHLGVWQLEGDIDRSSDREFQRNVNRHSSRPNVVTSSRCVFRIMEYAHANVGR